VFECEEQPPFWRRVAARQFKEFSVKILKTKINLDRFGVLGEEFADYRKLAWLAGGDGWHNRIASETAARHRVGPLSNQTSASDSAVKTSASIPVLRATVTPNFSGSRISTGTTIAALTQLRAAAAHSRLIK